MDNIHVKNETGNRLVVVREVAVDRSVERITRDSIVWPHDEPSQRMWALSAVLTSPALKFGPDADDLDDKFREAQRILDWITSHDH